MRLVAYSPGISVKRSENKLDRFLEDILSDDKGNSRAFPICLDLFESRDGYKIVADLPGMEKDNIKIMVEKDILTISGERSRGKNEKDNTIFSERFYGSFSRSFRLPENVVTSGVSADYKNGILEVSIPKKEETKPREIEIEVN